MAAQASQSSQSGGGPEESGGSAEDSAGSRLWHGVGLVRATAVDLAVLARHLVLYPTGLLPEREYEPDGTSQQCDANATTAPAAEGVRDAPAPSSALHAEGRGRPPVLLLHGFVDNRSTFTTLRRSLLEHGWPKVLGLNYSPLTSDLRTASVLLAQNVEQICERGGHRTVDIVGHSMGGLVARYYVQRLGGDRRVGTLVTLGTPHGGTKGIPSLVPHPLIRQMRPGSEVLTELEGPARGCRTRFVAFWSDMDELMVPAESARLEHRDLRTENIQVAGVGHLGLPLHSTVAAEIRRTLARRGRMPRAIDAA